MILDGLAEISGGLGATLSAMTHDVINPFDLHSTPPTADDEDWHQRLDSELYQPARTAGLTTDPIVYAKNYERFSTALDRIDAELNGRRFVLGGDKHTAADQWLAILLCCFELVFYSLYKLNRQRLEEFSNLAHYMRDVFSDRLFRNSIDLDALKQNYYLESELINPKHRMPMGSASLHDPHDRTLRFGAASADSDADEDQNRQRRSGEWVRKVSRHRNVITADGSSGFLAERGRYHLYISNNCPWSHRTALTRKLKGLDDVVSMDVLYFRRDPDRGWQFRPEEPGCTTDTIYGHQFIREIYARVSSDENSVPVLWDRHTQTIVSNESADIIRMFDGAFTEFAVPDCKLYPPVLQDQIDRINTFAYHAINNGAYKAGFANSQEAYEDAYRRLFDAFELLDYMLRGRRYLLGDALTEADIRLFPTIYRFDAIYYTRFNLNERMVQDIPSLNGWLENMLSIPGVVEASNLDHCRKGYFGRTGNNIVPLGPLTISGNRG